MIPDINDPNLDVFNNFSPKLFVLLQELVDFMSKILQLNSQQLKTDSSCLPKAHKWTVTWDICVISV